MRSDVGVCLKLVTLLVCHSEMLLCLMLIGSVLVITTFFNAFICRNERGREMIGLVKDLLEITPTINSVKP